MAPYDGTSDLVIHITNYNLVMKIAHAKDDEVKCLAFLMMLTR